MMRGNLQSLIYLFACSWALASTVAADEREVGLELRALEWQVPTPYFRPSGPSAVSANPTQPGGVITSQNEQQNETQRRGPLPPPPEADMACRAELKTVAVFQLTDAPPIDDPYCVIPDPVVLQSTLGSTPVTFGNQLTLDCAFALKLAQFVSGPAQDLAKKHRDRTLTKVVTGQGFACRRRNNAVFGKLSEHAFGDGVDIAAFEFSDGSRQSVVSGDQLADDEAAFQSAVRAAACGPFTTVLGPGSNAAHATHLHFDRGRSKGRKNPYLVCE